MSFLESISKKAIKDISFRKLYANICFVIEKKIDTPPPGWKMIKQENTLIVNIPFENIESNKTYLSRIACEIIVDYINRLFWFVFYNHMMSLCKDVQYKILINDFIIEYGLDPYYDDMLKKSFYRYRKGLVSAKKQELVDIF